MVAQDTAAAGTTTRRPGWRRLRIFGVWLFGALACIAFASYVVVRWTERQILTTDNYVALVGPLPKQTVVSEAVGREIGQQVFDEQAVESRIAQALPPRAGFLAGPLAGQLSALTVKASQRLVSSDTFQTLWEGANRIAMGRLLATARGQAPPLQARANQRFNINLAAVRGSLGTALGKAGQAIPALQPASQQLIGISADLQAKPRRIHQVVRAVDTSYIILPPAFAATALTALALSRRRILATASIAAGAVVLVLIELIGLKWLRGYALGKVQHPENSSAVSYIFDTLSAGLRSRLVVALIIMLVVLALCWAAGPARWAARFRSLVGVDRMAKGTAGRWWRQTRGWFGKWKYYLWLAIFVAVLGGLALAAHVDGLAMLRALLLVAALWSAVAIIGTPSGARASAR